MCKLNRLIVPSRGVYSVQLPFGGGQTTATEQKQGSQLVDAALAHGSVKQFVYTSADRGGPRSSSDPTNVPHFISKYHIEKHLINKAQGTNMGYTFFRPVAFMENLTKDFGGENCCSCAHACALYASCPLAAAHNRYCFHQCHQAFLLHILPHIRAA